MNKNGNGEDRVQSICFLKMYGIFICNCFSLIIKINNEKFNLYYNLRIKKFICTENENKI